MRLWKHILRQQHLADFLASHCDFVLCQGGSKIRWQCTGQVFSVSHTEHLISFINGRRYKERAQRAKSIDVEAICSDPATVSVFLPEEVAQDAVTFAHGLLYQRRINKCLSTPAPSLGAAVQRCRDKLPHDFSAKALTLAQQINRIKHVLPVDAPSAVSSGMDGCRLRRNAPVFYPVGLLNNEAPVSQLDAVLDYLAECKVSMVSDTRCGARREIRSPYVPSYLKDDVAVPGDVDVHTPSWLVGQLAVAVATPILWNEDDEFPAECAASCEAVATQWSHVKERIAVLCERSKQLALQFTTAREIVDMTFDKEHRLMERLYEAQLEGDVDTPLPAHVITHWRARGYHASLRDGRITLVSAILPDNHPDVIALRKYGFPEEQIAQHRLEGTPTVDDMLERIELHRVAAAKKAGAPSSDADLEKCSLPGCRTTLGRTRKKQGQARVHCCAIRTAVTHCR